MDLTIIANKYLKVGIVKQFPTTMEANWVFGPFVIDSLSINCFYFTKLAAKMGLLKQFTTNYVYISTVLQNIDIETSTYVGHEHDTI